MGVSWPEPSSLGPFQVRVSIRTPDRRRVSTRRRSPARAAPPSTVRTPANFPAARAASIWAKLPQSAIRSERPSIWA